MRFLLLATLGVALLLAPLWGQATPATDDATIDTILTQKAVTLGNAAWLVGRAVGTYDESVTPEQAVGLASKAGWVIKGRAAGEPVDLQSYGLILLKAFDIPTGMVYQWFPGPRYALRELTFRKILPSNLAPDDPVSGDEAMRYLQAAQNWKEAKR
jgi:hypothetical protein